MAILTFHFPFTVGPCCYIKAHGFLVLFSCSYFIPYVLLLWFVLKLKMIDWKHMLELNSASICHFINLKCLWHSISTVSIGLIRFWNKLIFDQWNINPYSTELVCLDLFRFFTSFDNGTCGGREGGWSNPSNHNVTTRREHNIPWWHNMVCGPSWGFPSWFAKCIRLGLWIGNVKLQGNPRRRSLLWTGYSLVSCLLCFQWLLSTEWEFWYSLQFWRNCCSH